MPHFDIIRKSSPKKTFRVASVMGAFDLEKEQIEERFVGDINLPDEWTIGLIVGNSGTGKTTIAKEIFPDSYITNFSYNHETILDDMPQKKISSRYNTDIQCRWIFITSIMAETLPSFVEWRENEV